MKYISRFKFSLILILVLCLSFPILADMQSIGGQQGIGGPISPNQIGGESFIRHTGNDKLIYDFKEGSGTTVKDKSREGNNGTFGAGAAAPTWRRNSLYFDGGDYVDLTGISHGISTGEFTLCFHIDSFPDIIEPYLAIFDQETVRFYVLKFLTDQKIHILSNKTVSDVIDPTLSPFNMQITRDNSGNLECHINGKPEALGATDNLDVTYDGTSRQTLGAEERQNIYFYTGTMYSFRILNKGLSGIEAQQIYLSNKFRGNN